jgi:hypothetical protein
VAQKRESKIMNTIHFKANQPQVISLAETSGVLEGFYVLYPTSDGKMLQLPHPAAVKLNQLDPAPGEEFTATKHQDGKGPAQWVFALTAKSEQIRASKETEEAEELARRTRRDLGGQLEESLKDRGIVAKSPGRPPIPMPAPPAVGTQDAFGPPRGTGTYGPVSQMALASRKTRFNPIPFNLAFREIVGFVTKELNASGEQWSEQSRQDLVSTVLIAGSKAGWIAPWERMEATQ